MRVKGLTWKRRLARPAIRRITDDGPTARREMRADLMAASGHRPAAKERHAYRRQVRIRKALEPGGGRIALLSPQPAVQKVLDIVKAVPGGIFKSIAELDEYLDAMQKQVRDPE